MSGTAVGFAVAYLRRGWQPIPIPPKSKGPLINEWEKLRFTEETIRQSFSNGHNIGLLLGTASGGLVDTDLDVPEAFALADLFLPATRMISGHAVKPRSHRWFVVDSANLTKKFVDTDNVTCLLELRGNSSNGTPLQTVVPPSIHPNGDLYVWGAEPPEPAKVSGAELQKSATHLAVAVLVARHWPYKSGEHGHEVVLALAGALLRSQLTLEESWRVISAAARAAGYTRARADDLRDTQKRLAAGQSAVGWSRLSDLLDAKVVGRLRDWLGVAAPMEQPGQTQKGNPWNFVENMEQFLADEGPPPAALVEGLLYPETVTEIFSPRGLGKTVYTLHTAVALAQSGKRVLYLDRDNPRRVTKSRIRACDGKGVSTLKALSRDKCPPLTKPDLWALFPYADYDVVIVDSLDSMAEGCGEQDSSKPSRAIAPILDIAHRENGPAVLLLGNTVRSGKHSRGSGVVEDRADIVYEVRDATDFHPTGKKTWVEELPPQSADDWAARSTRRKGRDKFRLAFICTKFRLGEEPAPFVMEADLTDEPWAIRDVTDLVDAEGVEARRQDAEKRAATVRKAVDILSAEILRRETAGETPPLKKQAEAFLTSAGLKRKIAREAMSSPAFKIDPTSGQGHPQVIRLTLITDNGGRNTHLKNTNKTLASDGADFGRVLEMGAAEIPTQETQCLCGSQSTPISAADPIYSAPQAQKMDEKPDQNDDEGEWEETTL